MALFGTLGLFVRAIPLPSSVIALVRGVLGVLFLLGVLALRHTKPDKTAIRQGWWLLCLSGVAIGFNWILLFEAYRYTTVAVATLCYYLAPIVVTLLSPWVLGEALTGRKLLCVLVALGGMVFVSGVPETGLPARGELTGIFCGLGAAVLYASVVLMNKKLPPTLGAFDQTIVQLAAASVVLLPYTLLTEEVSAFSLSPLGLCFLLILGFVHTGLAYTMYFGAMTQLPAQTVALFSYIDPVIAILISALALNEPLTPLGALGAILVLGGTLGSEVGGKGM